MRRTLLLAAVAAMISGAAQAQIKIGVAGPITGPYAATGLQLKNGVDQAVEDINAAGGVNGQRLQVVVGDDAADPRQAVSVANKFVSDGVKFVVGHATSGASIPASEVYAEANVLQVTPSATNPRFTERKLWNTFRTCGRDDQQGVVAGVFIGKVYAGKKVAVVHDKTPYGKGLADETQKAMNASGLKEVLYEGLNPGEKDYTAIVSRLKSANVDLVYYGGLYTEAGLLIRQMRDQGLNAPLMGGDGLASAEFTAIAGPGAEGSLMTFFPDPRKRPSGEQAVAKFRARNIDPEGFTLYAYAAVEAIAQGMRDAGTTSDAKKVADRLRSGQAIKTVVGDLNYNEAGDVQRPDFAIYAWKKGADGKIEYTGNEVLQP